MELNIEKNNKSKTNIPKQHKKTRMFIVLTFALIVAIIAYIVFRGMYLETLEIGENYINVFWQNIQYTIITLLINFAIIYFMIYMTNRYIKKGLKEFFNQENKQIPKLLNKSISFIVAIIVSAFTSQFILEKALLCFSNSQFGIPDPVSGLDIAYLMFQKPFIEFIIWYFMILIVALLIYTIAYYIISFNIFFDGIDRKTLKNSKLIKQIIFYIMTLAILLAILIIISTQNIGTEKFLTLKDDNMSYSLYGAGFTDVTIKLWGYRILGIVIIISIYLAIKAFKQGSTKKILIDVAIVPGYLVAMFIALIMFQALFVNSNELDKEKRYIEYNIKYTKNAYGIDIEEIDLENLGMITETDISANQQVLNNISIINKDIVLKDLNNVQIAKGYYSYRDTTIGKYIINGKEKLVYISPREIVNSNGTYNNKTYEHTHGYSTIITSATSTKEDGTIDNLQKGFEKTDEVITITEPRIYFGMQTNSTIVIDSKDKKEFDYPISDIENAENIYDGKAGLKLNFIDRIILAIKEGDLKLAFSGNVTSNSKILTNRNIIKRAQIVMPYLMYDENPYMVVTDDGKLVWVIDAYTISNSYPYSQKTTIRETATSKLELNYIRNSVKVLIDAYDGTTSFYITDRTDPIAMAYYNIYPDLFMDKDEQIPADISAHFTYPEFLYNIQADIITKYHNVQPDVLYRSDDIWKIATCNTGKVNTKNGTDIEPYYTMVKTIEEENTRLGLVIPYTPYGRQNLIAYLVGSYDNSGNSKLALYKYSADSNIIGPMQLDTQIEQDETISKELETLNVNGTKITKNIIVVPINNTILYVEPIYQQYLNEKNSEATSVLKKIVVASGNKVAIGDNLKQALSNLVSKYAVDIEIENTEDMEGLISAIIKANNNLTASNSSNNWEMIGKDIKRLQELVDKLEVLVQENMMKNELLNETNTNVLIDNNNVTANEI